MIKKEKNNMLYGDKLLTEISIVWCDEDVRETAKQIGYTLTDEEVSNVLWLLKHKHDATIGITWDTIDFWIREVVKERE